MSKPRFDQLKERLLLAGVAPSHVRRYVRELHDHYHDLYEAEQTRGLQPTAAEQAAHSKLGDDDTLAESMLAQPELRSVASRYPALVFGAAPFVVWLVLGVLALRGVQIAAMSYLDDIRAHVPIEQLVRALELLCLGLIRVLPVLFSALVFSSAIRQRSNARWPIIGATVLTFAGASVSVISTHGQIGISTSLLPGFRSPLLCGCDPNVVSALGESFARACWMLALTLIPYALWLKHRTRAY
jgi:hypothetical protein